MQACFWHTNDSVVCGLSAPEPQEHVKEDQVVVLGKHGLVPQTYEGVVGADADIAEQHGVYRRAQERADACQR